MQLLARLAILTLAFFPSFVRPQVSGGQIPNIPDIPQCGLQCLLLSSPSSGCSITDIPCQCQSTMLIHATGLCMLDNCTMADSLDTAKWQAGFCKLPKESKKRRLALTCNIVYCISLSCFLVRLSGKVMSKRLSYDDYFVLSAMVFATIAFGTITEMIRQGGGKHIWDLEQGQLKKALRMFYFAGNAYQISLGLVKMSLVALYLQIFRTRKTQCACYALYAFIIASTTSIALATIFSCTPVQFFWNRDIKGKCVNLTALGFANSALAIAQDVLIMAVPLPSLRTLHIKLWRKIAVGFMFTLGASGCVATIIRLRTVPHLKVSIDPTWDYSELIIWTAIELTIVAILASLPSLRVFLSILLTKIRTLSTSKKASSYASVKVSNRGRKGFSMISLPSSMHLVTQSPAKTSTNQSQSLESSTETEEIALVQIPERTWQAPRDLKASLEGLPFDEC